MIPVENAAGGAAAGLHHQTEGTPDQHADEITDIEENRDQEKTDPAIETASVPNANGSSKEDPENRNLIGSFGGADDVLLLCHLFSFIEWGIGKYHSFGGIYIGRFV